MEKLKAFLIHLIISAIICLPFFYLVYFIWYPFPLLSIEGGWSVVLILICVTLTLGPVLTTIVYKKGKKGMLFDLIFIATIQITAFIYGAVTLYQGRPLYIAFNIDRFNLIQASSININDLSDKSLKTHWFDKPKFVYIELPEDSTERMNITVEAIGGGNDFVMRPEFYREYQKFSTKIATDPHQLSLTKLLKYYPDIEAKITHIEHERHLSRDELAFYPLQGRKKDIVIILDKHNAQIIRTLNIDPWFVKN